MLYHRAFIAAGVTLFIAGCSGTGAPLTPGGSIGNPLISQAATKPILYVADLESNVVRLYDPNAPNPTPEGEITKGIEGPQGLAVDSKGALYVSNVGVTTPKSWISIYDLGKKTPRMMIPGPGFYGLAVDTKGDIFATYTGGSVYAYKPGARKPYEIIKGFEDPNGIAVDSKDNVWFADVTASKVYEIPAGTKTAKVVGLKGINGPVGLSIGGGDTIYIANFGPYNVKVYKAGSTTAAYTITDGITGPTQNGITAGNVFFQSNQHNDVVGYKLGAKTPFSKIVGNSDPLGIAAYPLVKR